MSYITESEEYKGYTIEIVNDEDPQNPRTDWDPAGTMVCWHSRYNLGDAESWKDSDGKRKSQQLSKNYSEPIDLLYELAELIRDDEQELREGEDISKGELIRLIEEKGTIIMPLYLYDHSGITISTGRFSCSWDSGQIGWIYITKEKIEAEGWTKEQAEKYLEGEVETYDDYLTGNMWGWRVVGDGENTEDGNSCWGYYGTEGIKDALQEARSSIDHMCEKAQEEYEKQPKHGYAEMATI